MRFLKISGIGILALMISACGSGASFSSAPSASEKTQALGESPQTDPPSVPTCGEPTGDSSVNIHDVGDVSALTDQEVLAIIICRAKAELQFKRNQYAEAEKRGESEHRLWAFRGLLHGLEKLVELLQTDENFAQHHVRLARNPAAGPPDRPF